MNGEAPVACAAGASSLVGPANGPRRLKPRLERHEVRLRGLGFGAGDGVRIASSAPDVGSPDRG